MAPLARPVGSQAVEIDRPAPGEELNPGEETVPRPAATVILLRGGAERLEVLLVRRNPESRFMGGAWVFPGGAVDRNEGTGDDSAPRGGARRTRRGGGHRHQPPGAARPVLALDHAGAGQDPVRYLVLSRPCTRRRRAGDRRLGDRRARWSTPQAALEDAAAGELFLVFPTIKHLEQLSASARPTSCSTNARGGEVKPVQPRVILGGEMARVLLPGEPGFDDT